MAKKSSSKRWLTEHHNDEYVKKAKKEGYRSRAVYKLIEAVARDKFIKPGDLVLDLGAAPGGWSQVAAQIVGKRGAVIASDILPIKPIVGVDFLLGDFTDDRTYRELHKLLAGRKIDVVLSDMAPNMSGQPSVDLPKAINLCDLALDMAKSVLKPNGSLFIKVFVGEGCDYFVQQNRQIFKKVTIRKPKASRPRSKEIYLLGST